MFLSSSNSYLPKLYASPLSNRPAWIVCPITPLQNMLRHAIFNQTGSLRQVNAWPRCKV